MKEISDLEVKLIKLEVYEQEIIIKKYQKRVDKEKLKEQEMLSDYTSIEEVREAYGYGEISDSEYERSLNYFESVEDKKSINEMFLEHIKRSKKENTKTLKYLEQELFNEELVAIARG